MRSLLCKRGFFFVLFLMHDEKIATMVIVAIFFVMVFISRL